MVPRVLIVLRAWKVAVGLYDDWYSVIVSLVITLHSGWRVLESTYGCNVARVWLIFLPPLEMMQLWYGEDVMR